VPPEPPQEAERRIDVAYDGRSLPLLWIAYKVGRFDPQDRVGLAGSLLADLAFGEASPIQRDLVLERQLVESIQANRELNRDPGTLDLIARVKTEAALAEVEAAIERTIALAQQELPDPRRLAELQARRRFEFLLRLDTPARVCSALARIVALSGGVAAVNELQRGYASIRPEEIREAARLLLRPERRSVVLLREKPR
jgi:zinc protease